jgi:uncharacterized membrane protein
LASNDDDDDCAAAAGGFCESSGFDIDDDFHSYKFFIIAR